jgi:hypothetical protein
VEVLRRGAIVAHLGELKCSGGGLVGVLHGSGEFGGPEWLGQGWWARGLMSRELKCTN